MVAKVFSMPAIAAGAREAVLQAETPLSDKRRELDRLIIIVDRLRREVEAAAKPPARLREVFEENNRRSDRLTESRKRDEQMLGRWLAEPTGARPSPSRETQAAEDALLALALDVAAAQAKLPRSRL
jgi:hypothetical protein